MITEEIKKMIEGKTVALGTSGELGPNIAPLACAKVVEDKIILTDNYLKPIKGSIKDNIQKDKRVVLAVWDDDEAFGYKIFGTLEYYKEGEWADYVKALPDNEGYPAKGALVINPENIVKIVT